MPEREFELYLDLLGRLLKLSPEQKSAISDELRDHLEVRFEELVQSGQSRDDAIRQALGEFGDAAGLAVDFTKVSRKKIRRVIVRTTAVTTAVTALAVFLPVYFGPGRGGENGPGGTAIVNADPGDAKPAVFAVDYLADQELFPEVLDRPSPVQFLDTPLQDALMHLSQLHEVPIIIDQAGLENFGITTDMPIRLNSESLPRAYFEARQKAADEKKPLPALPPDADEVPLRLVLDWICGPLNLAWYMDSGLLHVTTKDLELERLIPRSYDIGGLLKSGISSEALHHLLWSLDAWWEDMDGHGGTTAVFGNVLTVRQTWRVHRTIAELLAALSSGRKTPVRYLTDHDRHTRLLNQFQRKVTVNFVDTPLSDCIQFFAESLEIRIYIDASNLDDAGIASDEPVNLVLADMPLRKVVEAAFDPLALTLVVIDGRLTLTTRDISDETLHTVLYDISDVFVGEEVEKFVVAIQDTTSGMWEDIDGVGGQAGPLTDSGRFLVHQTDAVHSEIQEMIAWSRKTQGVDAEASRKAKVEAAAQAAQQLSTRFYQMDRDSAEDLLTLIPEVVDLESWKSDANPSGGFIRKVAAGRRIMELKGQVLSSQGQIGGSQTAPDGLDTKQPKESGTAKPPEIKSSLVIPEAILVIRQTQAVHRNIEEFLNDLGIAWSSPDRRFRASGGGMGGGGGYF